MTSKYSTVPDIKSAFERDTIRLRLEDIQPLHLFTESAKETPKYQQVRSSVREIGLVELPVVARDKDTPGKYLLVDGHMRIEILREIGVTEVECLVASDDEAFTYNKRVSRLATIQEHFMILKAIDSGVPEATIATTLNVNVAQIRLKKHLLKGICPEVVEILKDRFVPTNTFIELRKLGAVRQIEAVQLMVAMNKFSINYAKSLVGATPQSQLADTSQPKKLAGLSDAQIALMENESANLDREYRLIEASYGSDHLDLVVATGYLARLLENARVVRYLAQSFPEILAEFQKMTEAVRTPV
ncbi:ParB N-terminal domain-containing protein [Mesorhizobium sp. M0051]|uniref:plasmid partitioning protein RepB C-terminal domain-containing protein n=1 Tax=Mesorhizobium sp. M0051 TaxID=2956862 RepID=UPI00333AD4E9